jgi:protein-tyrosine phosphatase
MIRVIFVCLGNICRSPMAEAVFTNLVEKAGLNAQFEIDSAGTSGYHVGEWAHIGTRRILSKHHIDYQGRSRKITSSDLAKFDYIIALDSENLSDLKHFDTQRKNGHKFYKLLDFARQANISDVPDPYYLGNFEGVYQVVLDGCQGLLDHLRAEHTL